MICVFQMRDGQTYHAIQCDCTIQYKHKQVSKQGQNADGATCQEMIEIIIKLALIKCRLSLYSKQLDVV